MPAISYWFSGTALAAFLALIAAFAPITYTWYRAALAEQNAAEKAQKLAILDNYFIQGDTLFRRLLLLPKSVSDADYKQLQNDIEDWSRSLEKSVSDRFGRATALDLLEVSTGIPPQAPDPSYRPEIAKDRAATLYALLSQRRSLSELMSRTAVGNKN
jgi:hypothetical protein